MRRALIESSMLTLDVRHESFPVAGTFTISRGSKTTAEVVVVELRDASARGRGECVPYGRYGETLDGVMDQIRGLRDRLQAGLRRPQLQQTLPAGAARNGLDCALWAWEARRLGTTVHALAGLAPPEPVTTAYTLSLDTPTAMGEAARRHAQRPLLKLKLAGDGDDVARVAAVRRSAPGARLIVDANEGGRPDGVVDLCRRLADLEVALVEQPLPAGHDAALEDFEHPLPVCADESCHTTADLDRLRTRYDAVNIKLDKTGGLTEALRLCRAARAAGLQVMVGCMLATSLAMAPALLLTQDAEFVDLDGPLLLARDRQPGLRYQGGLVYPPPPDLWA